MIWKAAVVAGRIKLAARPDPGGRCLKLIEFTFKFFPVAFPVIERTDTVPVGNWSKGTYHSARVHAIYSGK